MLINDQRRQVLASRQWWFMEKPYTFTTTALTQGYTLRGDIERPLSDPTVTVGTVRYTPKEAPNLRFWNQLNLVQYYSDIPEWWFFYNGQIQLFPIPSAGTYTVTLSAKPKIIDLSIADYTTGTIVSVANAGTAVVGDSTSWTTGMGGLWMSITRSATANKGDGQWYEISSVTSTTALTLTRGYGGSAIATGAAAYTIGECSILPDQYDSLPLYRALTVYFTSIDPNEIKAQLYAGMAKELLDTMAKEQGSRSGGRVLDEGIDKTSIINPNLTIGF